ncbi:hypothetical protein [Thiomicrorhabdus lithotrophica]|uniref:Uncharacterized protein n=1 Tax=Thiomicrorhabdus lithotrophica TaxID=2949997 RepID=A0ABY8CBN3_9GAMM|nr:hypothetical protein [Thiomicrorhabdus lithotrophica]WEJ62612.1 hypothetical protein NR989_11445 [Thiomicrorhabdus lithotrophica]
MKYREIAGKLCEAFKKAMADQAWQITHQDVGQTELLAYGYVIAWAKDDNKVLLHYSDRQGKVQANLEISPAVYDEINTMIDNLI